MREGEVIGGRYVLGGPLGSGGMGRVYRARDERLGREVALKVLEERHAETPEFVERFEREATNAASLSHPNVVRVFDSGADEHGSPYIAMELVGGGTLKDRIHDRGPLPPREAATVVLQVAEALEAAHEAGIVHRDVKPENVLLTEDGGAKVADFGIAKATEATAVTHTSMVLGTAPYLSPEQAKGESVGPASDLYSLGVVLYEALTGRPPFGTGEDVSPLAIAMKHLNEPAPAARTSTPDVPEPLETIALALMRKDPAERHANAGVLADDLTAFLEGRPLRSKAAARVQDSPELAATGVMDRAPAPSARPPRRRRRAVVPVLAITLAALLALAVSPLGPPEDPFGLTTRLASAEPASVGRSVSPEVRGAPDPPKPPEEKAQTTEPKPPEQKPDPKPAPEPTRADAEVAPSAPEAPPAPAPDTPPAPNTTPTASASASAPASAPANDPASAPASDPASAPAETDVPTRTEEPAGAGASASASAPAPEGESVPDPQPAPEPQPAPDPAPPAAESSPSPASAASSAAPSSAAPSSAPPSEAPAPVTPAEPEPPDVEPPDVEVPDVEVPDVEVPDVEVPDFQRSGRTD